MILIPVKRSEISEMFNVMKDCLNKDFNQKDLHFQI